MWWMKRGAGMAIFKWPRSGLIGSAYIILSPSWLRIPQEAVFFVKSNAILSKVINRESILTVIYKVYDKLKA